MTSHKSEDAPHGTGRGWAYAGMLVGALVSTAANLAHSYIPPDTAPAWWPAGRQWDRTQWHPQTGAVIGAVFWPIALFLASELLVRIAWPEGWHWIVLRFGGLLPVAAVAAIVSYKHLSALIGYYGEDSLTAHIGPLAVDGLMVMATGALVATSGHRKAAASDTVSDTLSAVLDDVRATFEVVLADTMPDNSADMMSTDAATATDTRSDTMADNRSELPDADTDMPPDAPVDECPDTPDRGTDATPDIVAPPAPDTEADMPHDSADNADATFEAEGRRMIAEVGDTLPSAPESAQQGDPEPEKSINEAEDPALEEPEAPTPPKEPKEPPKRIPAPRGSSGTDTAAKMERLLKKHPDMSAVDLAKKLGVTDRTVRRYLADRRQTAELTAGTPGNRSPDTGTRINGHSPEPGPTH